MLNWTQQEDEKLLKTHATLLKKEQDWEKEKDKDKRGPKVPIWKTITQMPEFKEKTLQ